MELFDLSDEEWVVIGPLLPKQRRGPERRDDRQILNGIFYIWRTGAPWEKGYNERFNGTLRAEVLNAEWFSTIHQTQTVINIWLNQYNYIRPHQALNMRPPVPETLQRNGT